MKNNFFLINLIILYFLVCFKSIAEEQFNFNVTEIEILNNGNLIKGLKKGKVTSVDGIYIIADNFEYDKIKNILRAQGNVEFEDKLENNKIFTDELTYFKNIEKVVTNTNSVAIYEKNKIIKADNFEYDKIKNILRAQGNVEFEDKLENNKIFTDELTYFKNIEKVDTKGKSNFFINNKYEINSEDISYFKNRDFITSEKKTTIKDKKLNVYYLDKFSYQAEKKFLKGQNIILISKFGLPESEKLYFSSAMINIETGEFYAKNTEFEASRYIFGNSDNNPRLKGVSSSGNKNLKIINKGIFTSCKKNKNCLPWFVKAEKITHDKKKKQLIYDNAVLNIYDIPVLYFPKFFHPDPTVKRQSGFLKPQFNNSNVLGDSLIVPYYNVLSDNKDYTLTTHAFNKNFIMLENEYRQVNQSSNLKLNFNYVNNYKSSIDNKNKNISSLFAKYSKNLEFDNFNESSLNLSVEKVNNDTFLKVFDQNIQKNDLKPKNMNVLNSKAELTLDSSDYNFKSGFTIYEDLQKNSSDRYQYILPYYNFDRTFYEKNLRGNITLSSNGNNSLIDTNVLNSVATNNLNYSSDDYVSNLGIKNNIELDIKNLNSMGKNSTKYKSSPQVELMSILSFNSSIPLIRESKFTKEFLTPKISLKFNPSDMKNYADTKKNINVKNIFSNNRLSITDSLESGKSMSIGFDYKKENKDNRNNFVELNLAKVFRTEEEKFIPKNTTINKQESNLFGSIKTSFNDLLKLEYNFSIDNSYNEIEYNELNTSLSFQNIKSEFNFIKENGVMGDESIFENKTGYKFNESNSLNFSTRRNRKINLTEYYNLVYEYKNDCLVAGIKYNKTFYEDRELKPSENIFFSVTLIPLAEYEQKVSD